MKIMKLLASCAMVGALTAVCASGAFADKPIPVVDYVTEGEGAPYIKVAVPTEYVATGDYTVLVLNADVDDESRKGEDENGVAYNNVGKVTNADITQIDQWDGKTAIKLAVNTLADGTYYVRVGGSTDGYIDTTFTVGEDLDNPYANSTRKVGDLTGDGFIEAADVSPFLMHQAGISILEGENLQAADINDDGFVESADVSPFLMHQAGITTLPETYVKDKANYVD